VSTGKADDSVVEPGDKVDISGGGFAAGKGLKILLEGNATSTATASPTPTASPSPTAALANGAQIVHYLSGPTAAGRKGSGRAAAADTVTSLGVAISDTKGNFDDDVEIPDDTKPGSYKIVVTGPNKRGGTHRVNIPITVAADMSGSTSSSSPAASNATGTATQASPVSSTVTGSGTLPATGSGNMQTIFGLGLVGVLLGSSLLLAKRVAQRRVPVVAGGRVASQVPLVFEIPPGGSGTLPDGGLRGEMQRLLARRTDRYDPDRHTDL
jgi:LPXTG-motif cell wall-anchored protein